MRNVKKLSRCGYEPTVRRPPTSTCLPADASWISCWNASTSTRSDPRDNVCGAYCTLSSCCISVKSAISYAGGITSPRSDKSAFPTGNGGSTSPTPTCVDICSCSQQFVDATKPPIYAGFDTGTYTCSCRIFSTAQPCSTSELSE